jgi:hypothetical protein
VNGGGLLSRVIAIGTLSAKPQFSGRLAFCGTICEMYGVVLGADVAILVISFLRLVVNKGSDHLGADRGSRERERHAVGFSRGGSTARNSCANLWA